MRRFVTRTPTGSVLAAAIAVTMGLAGSCRTLPKGQMGMKIWYSPFWSGKVWRDYCLS